MKTTRREFIARSLMSAAMLAIGRNKSRAVTIECVFACIVLAGGVYIWFKLKGLCQAKLGPPPPPPATNAPPPPPTNSPAGRTLLQQPGGSVEAVLNDNPTYADISSCGFTDTAGGLFIGYFEMSLQTLQNELCGVFKCWMSSSKVRIACYKDAGGGALLLLSCSETTTAQVASFDLQLEPSDCRILRIK